MKKKLDKLNRKIRHSRKKHDGMVHNRNTLRKAIAGLKGIDIKATTSVEWGPSRASTKPTIEPEWNFKER